MNTLFGAYSIEALFGSLSLTAAAVGVGIILTLIIFALIFENRTSKLQTPIFTAIIVATIATSGIIMACSLYLAKSSAVGGTVAWQADFQIWACGNRIELRDPQSLYSNKIGSPTLHEHNDGKMHFEGTPIELPEDFSLGKFMSVIGGKITGTALDVPLNDSGYFINGFAPAPELAAGFVHAEPAGKIAMFSSGEVCGSQPAAVQAFVYRYNSQTAKYSQTKLANLANYEPTHANQNQKPDCVIIEFSPQKDRTSYICEGVN